MIAQNARTNEHYNFFIATCTKFLTSFGSGMTTRKIRKITIFP